MSKNNIKGKFGENVSRETILKVRQLRINRMKNGKL